MNNQLSKMNTKKPLNAIFPWSNLENQDNLEFRNLQHFTHTVSNLTQVDDYNCDVSYKEALSDFVSKKPRIGKTEQESIRNLVRSNLHKRGLITEEVYEQFKYATEGTQVGIDVGKYAAGEPDCVITPSHQYIDEFYELFISISYRWHIENNTIMKNVAKLLATVEELERQHIFIKVTLVLPIKNPAQGRNLFLSIPLFSHKEHKTVDTMSAVVNDRLLRKFVFAVLEDFYGSSLVPGYGHPVSLEKAMNIGDTFNEIEFFKGVKESLET